MSSRDEVSQPFLADPAVDLAQWVLTYIRRQQLLAPMDRVLVAVSGGPDSVALLYLLHRLRGVLGLKLGVAHFDHCLRGPESREDARFVAELAGSLDLPCHLGQGEVRDLAGEEKISLQMAGRRLRRQFLQAAGRTHSYTKLALGHTADDQVELFWLRVLRGAGLEGLGGMRPATPAGIVRPLLAVGKECLLAWLRTEAISYRIDASNLSRAYLRNRIRLDLLPHLAHHYNPRLAQVIWRTQALLQDEDRWLAGETEKAWAMVGQTLAEDLCALNLGRLFTLDPALQRRLLRAAAARVAGELTLTSPQVASLLALARSAKSGGLISLGNVLTVARAGQELHFCRPLPASPPEAATLLPAPPVAANSSTGWRWRLASRPYHGGDPRSPRPDTARVSLERVAFPLKVRYLQPGDRFWPQGARGLKKLQDFLVDCKMPRWLRPHLPLVESAGQIIWVAGLRVAESVKLTDPCPRCLEIKLTPISADARRIWEIFLVFQDPKRQAAAGLRELP